MPSMPAHDVINPEGDPRVLILCDHAANTVPQEVAGGDLGVSAADMARHIAWDVGARGVTLGLARRLDCPAVLSTFSRLVIDPNRGEDDPTLVMKLYDGSIIPANREVDGVEVAARLGAWHRPYHAAIRAAIDRAEAAGVRPALVSIHSFTPQLRGRPPRPWHVGVLWDADPRLAVPLLDRLRAEPDLCIGDNEPYVGHLVGDTMWTHGTLRGLPHALIEVRNDLIADAAGEDLWAARLAVVVAEALDRMRADA